MKLLRSQRSVVDGAHGAPRGPVAYPWAVAQTDARGRCATLRPLNLVAGTVIAADAILVFGMSLAVLIAGETGAPGWQQFAGSAAFASLLFYSILSRFGAYTTRIDDSVAAQSWHAWLAWTLTFAVLVAFGWLVGTSAWISPLVGILPCYVLGACGLVVARVAAAAWRRTWRARGHLASTIAVVDLAGSGPAMARRLTRHGRTDLRLLGVFSPDGARSHAGVADLVELSRLFRVDDVFVLIGAQAAQAAQAAQGSQHPDEVVAGVLRQLGAIPTNVHVCQVLPDLKGTTIKCADLRYDTPVFTVYRRPFGSWGVIAKRLEDLVIGSLALLLLLPVMALVAILIKIDSRGPVLFRQARQGFNNNVITVLKFRTMRHADRSDGTAGPVVQATRNDRRVTRVGRVLRRTSLDELPQIFNVLRGDMSLVGPRPHAVVHNTHYAAVIDDYLGRHRVQPGITGWAQINGLRGETDTVEKMQKRVEHDLFYIDHWSLFFDLKIIALTFVSVLRDPHAY